MRNSGVASYWKMTTQVDWAEKVFSLLAVTGSGTEYKSYHVAAVQDVDQVTHGILCAVLVTTL